RRWHLPPRSDCDVSRAQSLGRDFLERALPGCRNPQRSHARHDRGRPAERRGRWTKPAGLAARHPQRKQGEGLLDARRETMEESLVRGLAVRASADGTKNFKPQNLQKMTQRTQAKSE